MFITFRVTPVLFVWRRLWPSAGRPCHLCLSAALVYLCWQACVSVTGVTPPAGESGLFWEELWLEILSSLKSCEELWEELIQMFLQWHSCRSCWCSLKPAPIEKQVVTFKWHNKLFQSSYAQYPSWAWLGYLSIFFEYFSFSNFNFCSLNLKKANPIAPQM